MGGDIGRIRAEPPKGAADGLRNAARTVEDADHPQVFDSRTSTRPESRITPGSHRGGSGRRFATNAEAEAYGESVLGPIRDRLPDDELRGAYLYTKSSWFNVIVRHDDPEQQFNRLAQDFRRHQTLTEVTGKPFPTMADVALLVRRELGDPAHRSLVESIMKHPGPSTRLTEMKRNAHIFTILRETYGTGLTPAVLKQHLATLDRAVDQTLPEPLQVSRGLRDIEFMVVDERGTPLGNQDPKNLLGTVQRERGYISGCLGPELPGEFHSRYRLDLDLPDGAKGLWMGAESHYPHQRELILPRDTPYLITEVAENAAAGPGYRLRATVLPV